MQSIVNNNTFVLKFSIFFRILFEHDKEMFHIAGRMSSCPLLQGW